MRVALRGSQGLTGEGLQVANASICLSRAACCGAVAAACLVTHPRVVAGQAAAELPVRAAALAHPLAECPAWDSASVEAPTPEELAESRSLSAAAEEQALLGDLAFVRDLLQRALALDPRSQILAYRSARAHEDMGDVEQAIRAYCQAVALTDEAGDLGEVKERLEALQAPLGPPISQEALRQFETGVTLMAGGSLEEAARSFSSALASDSALADAYYNRGLVYGVLRRPQASVEDFRRYLGRRPEASDRVEVEAAIQFLVEPPVNYSAGKAFLLGLTLPGAGHFYTDRTLGGALFLAFTGGAAATGLFYEEVKIRCLSVPRDGVCPDEDIVSREQTRPFLGPAFGIVGASALVGAITAYRGARARNDAAGRLRISGSGVGVARGEGPRLLPPRAGLGWDGVVLEVVRLRF